MSVYQKPNSPFLFDSVTGHICGIKQEDGSETFFMLSSRVVGTPVDGVQATLTSDMTNANADVTLTAVNYGNEGNQISVTYINPSANSQALRVHCDGFAIKVYLATNSGGTITSTAALVAAAINAHATASLLVTATAEGSGAGVVNAKSIAYLAGGVRCTPGFAGSSIMVSADGTKIYRKATVQTWVQATAVSLASLADTNVSPSVNGQFLEYNNSTSKWVVSSKLTGVDKEELDTLADVATGVTCVNGVKAALTSDMTNANADITLTAVDFGAGGNSISVVYINPGAEAALSVTVAGNAITVNLASSAAPAITSTAAQVVAAINEHETASTMVLATYEGSGAGVVNAKSVASLTGGVTVTPGEIGSMRHKADGSVLYRKISAQVWKSVAMS